MSKLKVPKFSGPLDLPTVNAWLNKCEDVYEGYEAMNPGKITPALQILFTGISMEPTAAKWWEENCTALKALKTWPEFIMMVKEQFNPEGWKVAAVMNYYGVTQGKKDFRKFSNELQAAWTRISLGSFMIKDFIFKCHLLFFATHILTLCILAIPSLDFEKVSVDGLLNMMTTTWDALSTEGNIHQPPVVYCTSSTTVPLMSPSLNPYPAYTLPELSYAECQALKAAGGCYHCHLTPASKTWVNHMAQNCPGDAKNGIPPCRSVPMAPCTTVAAMIPTEDSDADDSGDDYGLVAAIGMSPSCVISSGTELDEVD